MRRSLVDIVGQEAVAGGLAALSGYLEAETAQEGTADGLVVGVGLVNDGADEVALLNPFALVQFQVRDENGFPLRLPTAPPPLLVHTAGGEDWSLDGPVPIVRVLRNGQPEVRNSLAGRVFRIAGRVEYLVSFAINRFLADGSPAGDPDGQATPAEVELSAGTYRLSAGTYRVRGIATLIHAEQTNESRILQSDEIEVRFGAPAA